MKEVKEFPTAEEASPDVAPVPAALASELVSVPVEASVVEVPSAEAVPSVVVPSAAAVPAASVPEAPAAGVTEPV